MNAIRKAYGIFRYLGPRVITLRAWVYLRQSLGITQRIFKPRPWETIDLAAITRPGTPADPT